MTNTVELMEGRPKRRWASCGEYKGNSELEVVRRILGPLFLNGTIGISVAAGSWVARARALETIFVISGELGGDSLSIAKIPEWGLGRLTIEVLEEFREGGSSVDANDADDDKVMMERSSRKLDDSFINHLIDKDEKTKVPLFIAG
jgi:hypothetical protein